MKNKISVTLARKTLFPENIPNYDEKTINSKKLKYPLIRKPLILKIVKSILYSKVNLKSFNSFRFWNWFYFDSEVHILNLKYVRVSKKTLKKTRMYYFVKWSVRLGKNSLIKPTLSHIKVCFILLKFHFKIVTKYILILPQSPSYKSYAKRMDFLNRKWVDFS